MSKIVSYMCTGDSVWKIADLLQLGEGVHGKFSQIDVVSKFIEKKVDVWGYLFVGKNSPLSKSVELITGDIFQSANLQMTRPSDSVNLYGEKVMVHPSLFVVTFKNKQNNTFYVVDCGSKDLKITYPVRCIVVDCEKEDLVEGVSKEKFYTEEEFTSSLDGILSEI